MIFKTKPIFTALAAATALSLIGCNSRPVEDYKNADEQIFEKHGFKIVALEFSSMGDRYYTLEKAKDNGITYRGAIRDQSVIVLQAIEGPQPQPQ